MDNKTTATNPIAFRGSFLHCLDKPSAGHHDAVEYFDDAVLLVEDGHISALNPVTSARLPANTELVDLRGYLIVPGFIDTHVHYPQVDAIASYGTQLLEWLEKYTFPLEETFIDPTVASTTAAFFLDELLRNGTTTALVFGTVHKESVDQFFSETTKRNLRMIAGKVLMDRNAPKALCDTVISGYEDSIELINRWHGKNRIGYAVTPRFAPTSSDAQLEMAGQLLQEHPDLHLHTHLAENAAECDWVADLFPNAMDYLHVYEQYGLVRKRSVFAHALHLDDSAWDRLSSAGASVAHCPTSNLFIGSGLFNLKAAMSRNIPVGLGTDVGGGDSFSILRTLNEAYKVQQLQKVSLSPETALYLATLGGARALDLENYIGNFSVGKECDFVVLNDKATPLLAKRSRANNTWQDQLFMLQMLGDDRCVFDTYIMGRSVKRGRL
ncbi:MAG: guanine deaminase [Gammaproteobacteria bacterium]|nr:guanine deaminase [Gammaproteobacteria bacterium]